MFTILIIDEYGETHPLNYSENEYPSLMELIRDKLVSEIGDCRGRVWCNTCVVQSEGVPTNINAPEHDEQGLLNEFDIPNIRLSCQLELNKNLDKTRWKIVNSRSFF